MTSNMEHGRYVVRSVAKAIRLIELIASTSADGLTLSELARLTDSSKSATYGLLYTLRESGLLRVSGYGPRYSLGMAFVRLGDIASHRLPLREIAAPVLGQLSDETGLTIRLAVADSGYPIFVSRVDAVGAVRFHAPLGVRELPHTSAAGKAILSSMPPTDIEAIATECGLPRRTDKTITTLDALQTDLALVRRRGYAVDDEEDFDGIFCVAAPICDHTGTCVGALSATGVRVDMPEWKIEKLGRLVRARADDVTRLLGPALRAEA